MQSDNKLSDSNFKALILSYFVTFMVFVYFIYKPLVYVITSIAMVIFLYKLIKKSLSAKKLIYWNLFIINAGIILFMVEGKTLFRIFILGFFLIWHGYYINKIVKGEIDD